MSMSTKKIWITRCLSLYGSSEKLHDQLGYGIDNIVVFIAQEMNDERFSSRCSSSG